MNQAFENNPTPIPATRVTRAQTEPWQPRVPFCDWAEGAKARAVKRRSLLKPFLENPNRPTHISNDAMRAQLEAAERIFGHRISDRTYRTWHYRAIDRDRGLENFNRLEIYGDEDVRAELPPPREKRRYDHSPLWDRLQFRNPARPTLKERQNALEYAFTHYRALVQLAPGEANQIKTGIIAYLWQTAPIIARTCKALVRNWNRKYNQWLAKGQKPSAIQDKRPISSGNFSIDDLEQDLSLIVDEAWSLDGKLSIAIRNLRRAGKLSQAFINRYTLDLRRNKSYIAKSIRKEIKARLQGLLAYRRSPWQVNMAGPRIQRDHTGYTPGDYFAADDVTLNSYGWFDDDYGRPDVGRPECLMFFDCRSLYPLAYIMVWRRYNGETVRRGILRVHDRFGLPHRGFIFEKGVWESRLLKGERLTGFLGWDEYELNLRERGLSVEMKNVTTPGAKLIEGVFNILQQNQRNQPGFVGFNERDYDQEELQKFIGRVKRGKVHPSEKLPSEAQWCKLLDASLEVYMHEPQNGDLLRGCSPAEMFASHRPFRKLADDSCFLLSTHRQRVRVKTNGISIDIRSKRRFFYNEQLGAFKGREVYAWFNVEQPNLLTVSDLENKNFFSIEWKPLPAFDATQEQLREANRRRHGFMRGDKARFDCIQHPVRNSIQRDNALDEDANALGAHIHEQTQRFQAEKSAKARKETILLRKAEEAGLVLTNPVRDPDDTITAIDAMRAIRAELSSSGGAEP